MTTEYEAPVQPFRGEDGKYQIRIESYDPARNTMKAIWLVSRNQRLLSQLLDKCEVSNSETSNAALRGNLLSVQRELQELREVMDHNDGTQTPIVDTSDLGLVRTSLHSAVRKCAVQGCGFEDLDSSALMSTWSDAAPPSTSSAQEEDAIQVERAASAFGFGASNRRRSVLALSRIPKYSRPSIRTDFCVSSFEPFPDLRAQPSKIPEPLKKKRSKKSNPAAPPRPKTSLSGRSSSRLNSSRDSGVSGRTSILKTSTLHTRPATSMALTSSAPKRVSFEDPIEAPRKPSRTRTTSSEKKKSKPAPATLKTKRTPEVRPATSMGLRTIPRTSSRLSNRSLESASGRSGRHSAMETSTRVRRPVSRGPVRPERPVKADTLPKTPSVKNRGAKTGPKRTTKAADKKPKLPVRPKSAIDVRPSPRPDVLPFESPPPQPKILEQAPTFTTFSENSREESASPLIRSISIIDDESENDDPFYAAKRQLPKIRVGEGEASEYKVKAYFLDEMEDLASIGPLNSGVIPSSPVELDSSVTRDSIPETQLANRHDVTGLSVNNTSPITTLEPIRAASAECNNTEAMETDTITHSTLPSEQTETGQASLEATSHRDPGHITSAFPELGMDFLPEFESEVHGLLDTLMSQDLLTSTFSQDFRLFSTESNFMDTTHAHPNEPEQLQIQQENNQEASNQVIRENEMGNVMEKDISSDPAAVDVAPLEPKEQQPMETRNELTAPEQENLNKDHSSDLAIDVVERSVSNVLDDDVEQDDGGIYGVEQDGELGTALEVPSGVASLQLLSSSLEGEPTSLSIQDEMPRHSVSLTDAVRRKSTGSHGATGIPSTAAAMKLTRHHRSASQNELDAIKTHFDGHIHSFPVPGSPKVDDGWCEDSNLAAVDPSLNAETCSMYASSELTLPDPCETYHDVHHGYSPSFATANAHELKKGDEDCCQSLTRSYSRLPNVEWCVFNPVGVLNSSQPRQASFDFHHGNRAQLGATALGSYDETPKSYLPTDTTLLRGYLLMRPEMRGDVEFDTVSSGKILTTTEGELDEIEACSSVDRPKDPFLKSTGSHSTWDERCVKEDDALGDRSSEGSDSVIPTMVQRDTDEDTVEDVPSSISLGTFHRPATSIRPTEISQKQLTPTPKVDRHGRVA